MNTFLTLLAEAPVLRYAVNLALGATSMALFGLLVARTFSRDAPWRQGILGSTVGMLVLFPLLVIPEWAGGWRPTPPHAAVPVSAPTKRPLEKPMKAATWPPRQTKALPSVATGGEQPLRLPTTLLSTAAAPSLSVVTTLRSLLWGGVTLWCLGSLLGAASILHTLYRLRRLREGAMPAGAAWQEQARYAATRVGLSDTPIVLLSPEVAVPCAVGTRHPVILIPGYALDLPPREAEAILIHETGHIAHHHALLGALMSLAGVLYGWIPPVRYVLDGLDDAMEDVCDNHVIRTQGDGLAMGRCLMRAAEAMLTRRTPILPGSAILRRKRSLPQRLRRVLEEDWMRSTTLTRMEWCAVALAFVGCLGAGILWRVGPARAETNEAIIKEVAKAEDIASYFPLTTGTEWKYNLTIAEQKKPTENYISVRRRLPLKDGKTCAELESRYDGRRGGWDYAGLRADGFYSYFNAYLGRPGVDEETPPVPLVKFPLEPGRRWAWHEPWRGQIQSERGHVPDTSTWGSDCTAVVEKEEVVTVPAGTFKTIRVKIERRGKVPGSSDMISWYAKGVGLVKRENHDLHGANLASVLELAAFTPGNSPTKPADVVPLVQSVAGNGAVLHEIALSGGTFRSRFVAAHEKGSSVSLYRVVGRSVTRFRPDSPADWNHLLAEEKVPRPTAPGGMEVEMTLDMGRLIAEGRGFTTDARTEITGFEMRGSDPKGIRYAVNGIYKNHPAWRVNVQFQANKQGEILSLRSNSLRY